MQVGITFDKQLLTSRQHAHFQALFLNHTDGVTKGCEVSQDSGNVYVQKGFFEISGRFVEVTGVETVQTPEVTSGTLYCKMVYEIDLTKTNTVSDFTQGYFRTLTSPDGYPAVTQQDLDGTGTLYQMPFCQYTKTVTAVENFVDIRPIFDLESVWQAVSENNQRYRERIERMILDLEGEGYLLIAQERNIKSAELKADAWTGDAAPYTQTVAVEGITEDDNPILVSMLADGADLATQKAYAKAYGFVSSGTGTTGNGTVTFKVYKKPATDIVVGLKGV